jgi:hypothetical protein
MTMLKARRKEGLANKRERTLPARHHIVIDEKPMTVKIAADPRVLPRLPVRIEAKDV